MSGSSTITEVVAGHANRTSDAVAISIVDGMLLTWKQLASLLAAAAEDWRKFGIGPTDLVATSTSTFVSTKPAAFLSVAGASGCIPLNSGYRPRECVDHMKTERTRALVVFGAEESDAVEAARSLGLLIIRLSRGVIMSGRWVAQAEGPSARIEARRAPAADHAALVLQTPGGQPLAQEASSLPPALHADLVVVAQHESSASSPRSPATASAAASSRALPSSRSPSPTTWRITMPTPSPSSGTKSAGEILEKVTRAK